ncbi:MAG TPA: Rieske 2Fe-2S domain-containing protein [Stellaceae bacterium]|nr:Rieske 2Fe-2S domain-containing protein [Stellaceae bacterium]
MADEAGPAIEGDDFVRKPWQPYLEASLGFRNHWYPAFFSKQLAEGQCLGQEMLGERILFKRIDGKVHAIEDRCAHRGVQLSRRPECHSKNTISCWYHGFTYDFRTGGLVAIVTDPDSALIGTLALKSYPVDERKNVVFVFIGDETPHALALDLQPGFLDEDLAIYPNGDHEIVKSNWRLAAENGVDASHIYIHRNSGLINAARKQLPLASYFMTREGMVIDKEGAPKGVLKGAGRRTSVWETEIEGVKVESQYRPGGEPSMANVTDTSLWLPCGLKVDPFPTSDSIQFEWYVPQDAHSHHYIVTWGRRVKTEAQIEKFTREMDAVWKDMVVNKFNNEDVIAREAMERFYAEEDGWNREYLYRPDVIITEWRKLASKHNRGIQRKQGAKAKAPTSAGKDDRP